MRCLSAEAEIVNHSLLRHPHVIQFKEVFLTTDFICIAMEYATGGSLFQYVQRAGKLKESVARWFFQQLIIGVDYCHRRGVANRDIKLENTLLQVVNGLPLPLLKICDFGYSKADFKSAAKSKVGMAEGCAAMPSSPAAALALRAAALAAAAMPGPASRALACRCWLLPPYRALAHGCRWAR